MPVKPKKKKVGELVGAWAFLIGVILAVLFAFFPLQEWVSWTLIIVGIIVGLLNIGEHEVQPFLLAGAVLVIVSYFGMSVFTPIHLGDITFARNLLGNILVLFVPTTIIVALKSVFSMAKEA